MDFARQTLEDYLKNERDMQERKRKKGTLDYSLYEIIQGKHRKTTALELFRCFP